jgi:CheY-like chemotaxis protein
VSRILIIEDNENNRYLARYLLEHAGFEVERPIGKSHHVVMVKRVPAA